MALNLKQQLFADYWLVDQNATQAAIKAGYSPKSAYSQGCDLLKRPEIAAYIEAHQAAASKSIHLDRKGVLDMWTQIVTADPSELAETKVGACRYCYGHLHQYQYTQGEWQRIEEQHEANRKYFKRSKRNEDEDDDDEFEELPSPKGGFGYDPRRDPHPDCPECFGEGVPRVVVHSSRGKKLYAGVKRTKDGIEVKTHDQMAALNNIAKNLGMLKDQVEHSGAVDTGDKTTRQVAIAAMALFRKTIESK